jgi:hypothetical protein
MTITWRLPHWPSSGRAWCTPTNSRREWYGSTSRWPRWRGVRWGTFVIEEIFCQLFSACERAHDVARAEQWLRVREAVTAQRNLPAVVAYCHTHFGGVMTAAGRWPEAEAALIDAVRLWALGRRTLQVGALVRLADLRIRQGRLEEAEQLLEGLSLDEETARPLAMLLLE